MAPVVPVVSAGAAPLDDLEAAWDELHAVIPPGWVAGRPMLREDAGIWEQYCYRPKERHDVGLREIRDGRWPM